MKSIGIHEGGEGETGGHPVTVHEGTKVRIDRVSEEWAEVVLEDGRVGWVQLGALETI